MLKLPTELTVESFLARHWQEEALFMKRAVERVRPSVSRNELAWLATLDDVESRIVFTTRSGDRVRYNAEAGPFEPEFLEALPPRDWTLLVHDVEKHLPALRRLFALVPFIPDWRIDDLMISFAAPGGGVGPHRDQYDVFLCQGIGIREWRVTSQDIEADANASDDLALTREFEGDIYEAREGDVLYLPPGTAHWGTAKRACITYSIGMRAPQLSDLSETLPDEEAHNPFYTDPDLAANESLPGYVSPQAIDRAGALLGARLEDRATTADALGRYVTRNKDWITPESPGPEAVAAALDRLANGGRMKVHGMARIAWDDTRVYVNGRSHDLPGDLRDRIQETCEKRQVSGPPGERQSARKLLSWMLSCGAFEVSGN